MTSRKGPYLGWLLATAAILFVRELPAQTNLGTIRGIAYDRSGGVMPGVTVKLISEHSGLERRTTTDESGAYEFPVTAPGSYTIEAEKEGFKKLVQTGFVLRSGLYARVNLPLEVGELTASVEVRDVGEALVQTDTATRQQVTSSSLLKSLPNLGTPSRDFLLSTLYAMPQFTAQDGLNGVRAANYSFNLDGVDVSSAQADKAYIIIPIEAIEEAKITFNSGSAETGFGAAQINAITKSGTNSFHGSLFEFYASNLWVARNAADVRQPTPRPSRFSRHELGFTVGGPVLLPKYSGRNKTFFFVAWDKLISHGAPDVRRTTSPTVKMRNGDFSEIGFPLRDPLSGATIATQTVFPNNVIPGSRIAPVARRLWEEYLRDLPNLPGLAANLQQAPGPGNNVDGSERWAIRLDHIIGSKDVFTGHFNGMFHHVEQYQDRGSAQTHNMIRFLPNSPNFNLGAQWVHTFNPRLFADTTFNYRFMTLKQTFLPIHPDFKFFYKSTGLKPPPGLVESEDQPWTLYGPFFEFGGLGAIDRFGPFPDNPVNRDDEGVFFAERLSYIRGKHTLKFGPELKFEFMTPDFSGNWRGSFSYTGDRNDPLSTGWAAADFLLGLGRSSSYRGRAATHASRITRPRYAAYIQDEWKVTPRLTLNLGVRWEHIGPLTEEQNELSQFDLDTNKIVVAGDRIPPDLGDKFAGIPLVSASSLGLGRNVWRTPKKNFTPRVSVAYRPFGGTKTVVRGGYSMHYQDESLFNQYFAAQAPPFVYSLSARTQPGEGRITWDSLFPASSIQKTSFSTRPRDWPVERFQQWNVTIEREVGWNTAVSIGYLGSRIGLGHLAIDRNFPLAAGVNPDGTFVFVRPFPDANGITYQSSEGYYRSHAMQVDLRRRFAQGLTFDGSYLWSKAIDNGWPGGFNGPLKFLPNERARSGGTRTAAFISRFLWDLPVGQKRHLYKNMNALLDSIFGGWTFSGILRAETGTYFHTTFSNTLASFGVSGNRPDAVPGKRWDQDIPPGLWFNPAAFSVPAPPTGGEIRYGTLGRNIIPGPGQWNLNATISKFFRIYEQHRLELRAEAFNAFNHPNLGGPAANVSDPNTVGRIFSAGPARLWKFALRYEF